MAKGRDRHPRSARSGSGRRRAGRAQPRRDRPGPRHSGPTAQVEDQPLIRALRAALRDEPFALVGQVSSILSALEPEGSRAGEAPPASLGELVESFLDVDVAETTAALHAIAALTRDEVLAGRIRRELPSRRQPVPDVVLHLGEARVTDAVIMSDELDDGESVILAVRWPDGYEITSVVYIDHNLGTIVKDTVVVQEPSAQVLQAYRDLMAEQRHPPRLEALSLADARAKIAEATEAGRDYEPLEGESQWPAVRPFLQLLLRSMPAGGDPTSGRPQYPEVSVEEAVAGFLGSPEASRVVGVSVTETAEVVALLVGHAAEHSGHPLRWSGATVELALTQHLPWDPSIDEQTLEAVPHVLPALVVYSHRVLGMSAESTADTLESAKHWTGEFDRLRALPAMAEWRESATQLAALLAGDLGPWRRRMLVEELGSQAAVDSLDTEPLPDEELDLAQVPTDVHSRVREVVALTDSFTDEAGELGSFDYAESAAGPTLAIGGDAAQGRMLANEFRTACRRFVARAAANDPAIFRRRGRVETAAAAVVWAVGRANELVGPPPAAIPSGQAQAWFGLSGSASQRAGPMLRALGVDTDTLLGGVLLGTPDLLTSARRGVLLRMRDALADAVQ